MQTYEVTGKHVTIGIGTELKLSESQADSRSSSLKNKKKDLFEVVDPVQFKQGEKITISPDALTKSLSENLKEISDRKSESKNEVDYPRMQHAGSGKYNVYDKNKNLVTSKPIKKHEAEKLLSEILAQSQENDDSDDDENDEESDSGNLGNV